MKDKVLIELRERLDKLNTSSLIYNEVCCIIDKLINYHSISFFSYTKDGTIKSDYIKIHDNYSITEEEVYKKGEGVVGNMFMSNSDKYSSPQIISNDNFYRDSFTDESYKVTIDQVFHKKYEEIIPLSHTEKINSIILIPINGSKRTFAIIRIITLIDNDKIDSKFLKIILVIADIVAHRVSTLRLKAITDSILKINDIIHKQLSEEKSIESIVNNIINLSDSYSICLIHKFEKDILKLVAASSEISNNLDFKVGEGIIGNVFLNGEMEKIEDLNNTDAKLKYYDWVEKVGVKSMICFPLNSSDNTMKFGTITILIKFSYKFEDYDIKYLTDYSFQISNLIQSINDRRNNDFIEQLSLKIISDEDINDIYQYVIEHFDSIQEFLYCAIIRKVGGSNRVVACSNDSLLDFIIPSDHELLISMRSAPDTLILNSSEVIKHFPDFRKSYPEVNAMIIIPFITLNEELKGALILMKSQEIDYVERYLDIINNNNIYQIQTLKYTLANLALTSEKKEHNQIINSVIQKIEKEQKFQSSIKIILREIMLAINSHIGYISILEKGDTYIKPTSALIVNDGKIIPLSERKFNKDFIIGETGITGYIFKSKTPKPYMYPSKPEVDVLYVDYYCNLVHEIENEIICPLLFNYKQDDKGKSEVIGFISVASYNKNHFSNEQVRFIQTISQRTINILINHHIHDLTLTLADTKFSALDTSSICNTLSTKANSIMKTNVACIWIVDKSETKRVLKMKSVSIKMKDDKIDFRNYDMVEDEGITWGVLKNKIPYITKKLKQNKKYKHPEFLDRYGLETMLTVPLKIQDDILGAINIYSQRDVSFHHDEIRLFRSLADRGAYALRNIELNEEIKQIFNIATPLCEIDVDYNIIRVNKTFTELFEIQESDVLHNKCYDMANCPNYETDKCAVKRLIVNGITPFHEEIERSYNNKKTTIPCIVTASKRTDINGKTTIVENYVDISKKKALEEYLANFTSHDMKNSVQALDAVIYNIDIANFGQKDIDTITLCLKNIRLSLNEFSKLIPNTNKKEFMIRELHKAIEINNRNSINEKSIVLVTDFDKTNDTTIYQPFHTLLQVLNNLILNAIKAIEISNSRIRKILLDTKIIHKEVNIRIADSGVGIEDEDKNKIFDMYYTTTGGSGIGLHHARESLEAINGAISITESFGNFSTVFTIKFPLGYEQ